MATLRLLLSTTTTFAATDATQIEFIRFNVPRQRFTVRKEGARSQLLQPVPSGLVTAQSKQLLQSDCVDPGFPG